MTFFPFFFFLVVYINFRLLLCFFSEESFGTFRIKVRTKVFYLSGERGK